LNRTRDRTRLTLLVSIGSQKSILVGFSEVRFDRRECRPALRRSEILRPRISGNPASDQKAASAAAQSRSTPKSRCQKQQGAGPAFSVAFIVAAYSRGSTVKTTSFSY